MKNTKERKPLTRRSVGEKVFFVGFILSLLAFFINLIGFCTPYWLRSWPRVHSKFLKLGLWEACFGGYVHPQDYNSKAYYGCWWILSKEFWYIRDWLMPPWFIACQVFSCFIIIGLLIGAIMAIYNFLRGNDRRKPRTLSINAYLLLACAVLESLVVILFGVYSEHRDWMPRPHENFMSWSYGFVVLSGFFAIFSGIALKVYAIMRQIEIDEKQFPANRPPSVREMRM